MDKLLNICGDLLEGKKTIEDLRKDADLYNVYPQSIYIKDNSILFMIKKNRVKQLIVLGEGTLLHEFEGEFILSNRGKICSTNHVNSQILRKAFPFTAPISSKGRKTSLGLGDRLGLASVGHIKLIKDYDVFPILAQQSIRELALTGRNYNDVLDSATWAVFQENYQTGFGADGDHLKTAEEVEMALDCGYTMITLDCSEYINNSANQLSEIEVQEEYSKVSHSIKNELEQRYMNKTFSLGEEDVNITFEEIDFKRIILIYLETITFINMIYNSLLSKLDDKIDFEISVDETLFSTSIQAHFLIASELIRNGVKIITLAPRFSGEFQKGIDYIGNKEEFKENFYLHSLVAKHFGYKLSIHSGSDKFKIFPIVGDITKGKYHLKTAGTNWLEAMRVIAVRDTKLFREVFQFALDNLELAKAYYHINGDPNKLPQLEDIQDNDLVKLLDNDNARQILHITYGLILQQKNDKNEYVFKNEIYNVLSDYEYIYNEFLYKHIGKHLKELKLQKIY